MSISTMKVVPTLAVMSLCGAVALSVPSATAHVNAQPANQQSQPFPIVANAVATDGTGTNQTPSDPSHWTFQDQAGSGSVDVLVSSDELGILLRYEREDPVLVIVPFELLPSMPDLETLRTGYSSHGVWEVEGGFVVAPAGLMGDNGTVTLCEDQKARWLKGVNIADLNSSADNVEIGNRLINAMQHGMMSSAGASHTTSSVDGIIPVDFIWRTIRGLLPRLILLFLCWALGINCEWIRHILDH